MQIEGKIANEPWEALLDNISQGKVCHAILLHGSSLSILSQYAYNLASHILLKDTPEARYKISQKLHPDIQEFQPSGKGRLHSIEIPRDIKKQIAIFPYEGYYKIYIIHEVDRMTLPAISVFLKVLEEAPSHSVIILTSAKLQRIPATILSRSLSIHIQGQEKTNPNEEEIAYLLKYASGEMSITEVGKIVKGSADTDKQVLRDKAKYLLEVLLTLFRDRFMLSLNISASAMTYPQYAKGILNLPILPLEKVLVIIEKAYQALDNSSSATSCMEWVALQLASLNHRSSVLIERTCP
ncbi:DNA polymerase III subunit delta' [Chlamydia psittaci]|uniref:DNA polymerase III subunit delta' n=1 Tax=Chlamydia psittaci TaxID=83554 RepID=UPI00027E532B|nr:DNA polymerase III subunit delta' [Chlamydia psittaci]EPJ24715.1 DNA polymerase III, delta subunit [Chlamydia psittaci 09DC77]EPJ29641.1 DNA polymerase III, delta subunit [Chlamydia psittaci 09DC78]EPL01204.1 DNA polymerase III, delta subunit [Chlamydia psittaci 09DC79]AFS26989.1 DNA polymerase III subunit gamma/tau [Chlamydia psittaci CP3]EPJ26442.1 DNA polymerase III, delta subunit [Chlamydia psittaci 09DC80]